MRRLIATLAVVAVVLVGVDRVAAYITERELANSIQSQQHLTTRPVVTIRGFPFLTQVVTGSYQEIDVHSTVPITKNGLQISDARVHLRGVKVGLADLIHGTVRNVPVQSGTGSALITFPALNALLHRYASSLISLSDGGQGRLRLTGPLGLSVTVGSTIENGDLRLDGVPDSSDLSSLPSSIQALVLKALRTPLPLPAFPFNVHLTTGRVTARGLQLAATAHNSVFPTR
jgi:hypothetical protein